MPVLPRGRWRWVFLVNVPAGCLGVVAARYLLPRTRKGTTARRSGAPGTLFPALFLLTLLLLASRVSGLRMSSGESACLVVACVVSMLCLWHSARRTRPAVNPATATRTWAGAAVLGITAGRFALFAPLVLLPRLCSAGGVHPATAGMITAALPAGYALAALPIPAPRFLRRTGDGFGGSMIAAAGCTAATAGIAADPALGAANAGPLAVFGICLGVLVIRWNAAVVSEGGPRGTGSAGDLGMALSVAAVTLCLHLTRPPASDPAGARLTLAVVDLALFVLVALIAVTALRTRRPRESSVHATGTPPDARFLLANERTFLAWNRTALALVAAGLAIVQLLHPFPGVPWGRHLLAVPLILLGAAIAAIGYLELRRNQRALHRAEPCHLPSCPRSWRSP